MRISAVPHLSPSDIRAPGVNDNEEAGWAVGAEWAYQGHIYKHVGNGAWVDLAGGGGGGAAPHAPTHTTGGSDPVTVTQAQVTGLTAALDAKVDEGDPRLTDARTPTAHALISHPASGLTAGHVLRATGATAYGFGAIQDADLPAGVARDSEVTAAIGAHEAAADPHPGYQRESEKGAANGYAPLDASSKVPAVNLGGSGADGTKYLRDDGTWQTPPGGAGGTASGKTVVLHHPHMSASAAATNLAANTFNAVSDPNFRQMVDLRGLTKVRLQGRIGGTLVAATRLRLQYHLGGNPAVVTGDAGWTTLAESAGSHTVNAMFYSSELAVPVAAQVNNCLIRVGVFGGDSVADPTISCCVLNFYP